MANRPEKTTVDQERKTRHQPRTTTERTQGTKRRPTTQKHHAAKTTDDGNLQGHELQGKTPRQKQLPRVAVVGGPMRSG